MPRDADALLIRKWAATGDVATPESQGLDRSVGWPVSYSQAGGDTPEREVFNQLDREMTALAVELNTHGLLEWDDEITYDHPALVMGTDASVYVSVQDSLNRNPTTDTSNTYWALLSALPDLSVTTAKLAANAVTNAKIAAGNVTNSKIASMAASKLSGTISLARIPSLPASRITAGRSRRPRYPTCPPPKSQAGHCPPPDCLSATLPRRSTYVALTPNAITSGRTCASRRYQRLPRASEDLPGGGGRR